MVASIQTNSFSFAKFSQFNPLPFTSMLEHVVTYSSETCESMLQLTAQSMGEHVSILICVLTWFTLRSLALIQDASVFHYSMFAIDKCVWDK